MKISKKDLKRYNKIRNDLFEGRGSFNKKLMELLRLDNVRKENVTKFSLLKYDRGKLRVSYQEKFNTELDYLVDRLIDEDPTVLNHSDDKKKVIRNAIRIALEHHNGRMRKGRKFLYLTHPYQVSRYAARHKLGLDMVVSGIIHDISEEFFKRFQKTDIDMRDVMEHAKAYLLKNTKKTKNLEGLVDDCVDMASHMSKPVEEPWHKYLGRVMNERINLTTKTITLKYLDLVYNILDFDKPHDYGNLKSSTRLTFVGKNMLMENELRKLEKEGLNLSWKKEELDNLRDANLFFSINECNNNIDFLKTKLDKGYVNNTKKQLEIYEKSGNFDRKTRKPSVKELRYAPWKKFDGVLSTLFSYWRGDFKINKLNHDHKTLFDYFLGLKRGLELMYLDRDRVVKNITLYEDIGKKR